MEELSDGGLRLVDHIEISHAHYTYAGAAISLTPDERRDRFVDAAAVTEQALGKSFLELDSEQYELLKEAMAINFKSVRVAATFLDSLGIKNLDKSPDDIPLIGEARKACCLAGYAIALSQDFIDAKIVAPRYKVVNA